MCVGVKKNVAESIFVTRVLCGWFSVSIAWMAKLEAGSPHAWMISKQLRGLFAGENLPWCVPEPHGNERR
jgi:hypothetical protein